MEQPTESAALAQWDAEKRRLTVLAYNMLGVWAQAEDVVSEVAEQLLKLTPAATEQVRNWPAFLTTLATRRAIDVLRSAQRQRTDYVGEWLPEPVGQLALPEDEALTGSMLRLGVLFLLEELSPQTRAAYVLHHALGYKAAEIAEVLEASPAAVRQLLSRAGKKLGHTEAPSREASEISSLLSKVVAAIRHGDAEELVQLLAKDAVLYSDGGGKARAALNPVLGAQRIARFLVGVERKNPGRSVFLGEMNQAPALLFKLAGRQDVVAIEVAAGHIQTILLVSNPDKLSHASAQWTILDG
ncbi:MULTISPECIES: sigma-70 family RNA polymerase sigma factor [Glutamicibacter]|uniref:RNA polymerase sigma factor n=1 Tax=Glutamicibacter nicotianae TaxID=37929 RepID=A0ABQ0RLR2_GLUNI|nr:MULTISPECIES: sigma-70 family RNA polymerase sigma factor [Glutamicibacter]QEP08305.1 sigma-70 family RNA polymerase sigma factor [Glutamicibacter sp. ZJUTW]GEC12465.1 RNA polymerase sigma factor [Glutamicibacter nicotianae]